MKTYTIIGGVNGAGKSSLTGVLRTEMHDLGRIIDVDRLVARAGGDAIAGGKLAIEQIDECLRDGICFTQETTLSGHRTLQTVRRALDAGYYIRLYYVGLDTVDESLARIRNRVAKGGHDIPAERVRQRFATRFSDVARILPYCNEATFYDNDNGFVAVATYKNGELSPIGHRSPQWLAELEAALNP